MSSVSITSTFGRIGGAAAALGRSGAIGVSRGSDPVVVGCGPAWCVS